MPPVRFQNIRYCLLFLLCGFTGLTRASEKDSIPFTRADTLRGSNGPGRNWWNLVQYDITVEPDYVQKSIRGNNIITFRVVEQTGPAEMQIDLQVPMELTSVSIDFKAATYRRDGNAYFIQFPGSGKNQLHQLHCSFSGKPRQAITPPWDGGWIWTKDKTGNPWMTVACQGLGASVWYPCKDIQADEPDNGAILRIIVPDTLTAVSNGRMLTKEKLDGNRVQYNWAVKNPINNYNIVPYIGKYEHIHSIYQGEKGPLDMDYWIMPYNKEKAIKQFEDAPRMLKAFEHWFGPYPFYEDGYKLVESPHLGMEHQSAIAYGNGYRNGYMGRDLSSSGWGLKWDFIIVHESGHEWFANNITTADIADMWVHEGFTNYSETLFTEYYYGAEAATAYVSGIRTLVSNDIPIIGPYGVNKEGSGDMYYKAGNMIHFIRQVVNNDETFRQLLRNMNSTFYHQVVSTEQIESFINRETGMSFGRLFDQYLRTTRIPLLEWQINGRKIRYRWNRVVKGFDMPVKVNIGSESAIWLRPSERWKKYKMSKKSSSGLKLVIDKNFFVEAQEIKK